MTDYKIKEIPKFHENIEAIENYLENPSKQTIIVAIKNYQIKTLTKHLKCPYLITKKDEIIEQNVNFIDLDIEEGFIYQDKTLITATELFNITRKKQVYKTKFKYATKIKDVNKLEIGDYIVHNESGIGIYNGIKTLTSNNIKKDYIEVLYKGNDSYLGNTPFPNFQLKKDYVLASKFDSIEEARDIINSYKEDIKRCSANTLENDFEFTITKLQTLVEVKVVESVEF